ncbi:helix-turn-helix domain-containing protein [Adlercreutzia faecimuris]|uniref:helix-turn-helix domain-containing protein n=1 Tax=Adlercreutzia faecimuris TaxID=2897341 RepID=UPI003D2FDF6E
MFGKRLRQARMDAGLTQQALADLIGVSLRNYQNYEQGSRNPPLDTLASIAATLRVSADYLLGLTDHSEPYERRWILLDNADER